MEILWLAIILYSIGLAIILHFRPSLMFNEDGTWKEFGYQRSTDSRRTIFPFWLFAIVWAFGSYAMAAAIAWMFNLSSPAPLAIGAAAFSSMTPATSTFGSSGSSYLQEDYEEEEEDQATPPVKRGRGRPRKSETKQETKSETKSETKQPRAGYYVLDPESERGGLKKYVYYGDKPPSN
jgi:hypothetical protein